jgi:alkanesulfonate monooxygenase SsuD/methylene tetrahydromethanopterin reductase-like flavin-dependent oxidoreductase (luciferase family)
MLVVVRVGLLFDLRNPPGWERPWADHYGRTLELCEEAEHQGIGGIWVTEHHLFEDGYLPQPLTFLAAVAARTSRVRLGTSVMLAPLRAAAQLAEEAAVVDLLSGGRLELGFGAGYRVPEFELYGVDISDRYGLVGNHIEEILRLWRDEITTPLPIQRPVPIWGGFYGPRGSELAGRLGIGLLSLRRPNVERYLAGLDAAGHDRSAARVSGTVVNMVITDDPEAAWPRIRLCVAHHHRTYERYAIEGTGAPVPPVRDPEDYRRPAGEGEAPQFSLLTPDEAVAMLSRRTQGLPVEHLILLASMAGMPDDLVERQIELICNDVFPRLA